MVQFLVKTVTITVIIHKIGCSVNYYYDTKLLCMSY